MTVIIMSNEELSHDRSEDKMSVCTPAADAGAQTDCIRDGEHLVVKDLSSGFSRVEFIDSSKKGNLTLLKKFSIPAKAIIGLPYGSSIHKVGGQWVPCGRVNALAFVSAVQKAIDSEAQSGLEPQRGAAGELGDDVASRRKRPAPSKIEEESGGESASRGREEADDESGQKSGKDIVDDNMAQKLTADEVIELKRQGTSGVELISRIAQNSESFDLRSEFSQEKYIKRKLARHILQLSLERVTPLSVAEAFGEPAKVGGLRMDYLGSMLNEGNVSSDSLVCVFDHSQGLLTSAVLRRLSYEDGGRCFFLSQYPGVSDHISRLSNFDSVRRAPYHEVPFSIFRQVASSSTPTSGSNISNTPGEDWKSYFTWKETCEHVLTDERRSAEDRERAAVAIAKRKLRYTKRIEAFDRLRTNKLDTFIAVVDPAKFEASSPALMTELLSHLYRMALALLRPCGRLVVYSQVMEPLGSLHAYIKARRETWTNSRFEEMALRTVSFLSKRSHPQMDNSVRLYEGFVLYATRAYGTEESPTPLF